jgi:hypothetical protein
MFPVFVYIILNTFHFISMKPANLTNRNEECVTWVQKHVFNNTQLHTNNHVRHPLIYVQFENFNQLINTQCDEHVKFDTQNLLLNAERKILIENYLNLNNLLHLFNFMKAPNDAPNILVRNIKGFDQNSFHKYSNFAITNYEIYFSSVNFEFYLNSTLITKDMCNYANFNEKPINFFWAMTKIIFSYEVSYTSPICPYVFVNSQVVILGMYEITNSFIFKNRLEFINVDDDISTLNGPSYLVINIVFEELTTKILCPRVFKNLQFFSVNGAPSKIQSNLFEPFKKIEYILFTMDSLKNFLQRGIQWMSYLNKDILNVTKLDLERYSNRVIIIEFKELFAKSLFEAYTYPNEDICLFESFPHKQLVIPSLNIVADDLKCTCILIWLIQNYKIFFLQNFPRDLKLKNQYEKYFKKHNVTRCMTNENYSLLFESCRFEEKFNNCLSSDYSNVSYKVSALDLFFIFEWLKLVIEVYAKTFFSMLGLIANILIIVVLKNKKFKRNFDNLMYRHICYNSIFNLIFCGINSFSLINICIFPKSSFCSSVYKTQLAQYFKIIFTLYLGNSIRLCCNFSFILFSFSRFFITTSKNWKIYLLIKKLNLKIFYAILFISCSLWSMFKLFEYKPNEVYSSFDKNFPYNRFDLKYCQKVDGDYKILSSRCRIFPILNLINNTLNNIVFFFISVTIDIFMIRFANKKYQHSIQLFHDQKHLDEALEHRRKIRKLIVINGILYFFSHIPEFVSTVLFIVFKKQLEYFCFFSFLSCTEMNEIFETLSIFSISLQFFVYKHFDKNFYESYQDLKNKF